MHNLVQDDDALAFSSFQPRWRALDSHKAVNCFCANKAASDFSLASSHPQAVPCQHAADDPKPQLLEALVHRTIGLQSSSGGTESQSQLQGGQDVEAEANPSIKCQYRGGPTIYAAKKIAIKPRAAFKTPARTAISPLSTFFS
ncbi:2-succinylbenzoate--CoA ligase [Striga asiatica]|uniref:2-succinylbenzoate--CoA ligase n=1 Tax=Striga asiatica TaxID=4170 RepID=A0A5A7QF47_STRAF|nr:2-succinylbenzoate--CoA ligase [Striga asiatica]